MDAPITNGANGRWRLTKDIPISLVVFLAFQTILFTWFLAGQSAKLAAVVEDNATNKANQYTKEDARHEREFQDQKYLLLQNTNDEQTRRIALVESLVGELRNRANKQ